MNLGLIQNNKDQYIFCVKYALDHGYDAITTFVKN
jgi:hypothetical protein